MKYYAVKVGLEPGIYESWAEAEPLVKGFPMAKYKSFKTLEEARSYMEDRKAEVGEIEPAKTEEKRQSKSAAVNGGKNSAWNANKKNKVYLDLRNENVSMIPSLIEIPTVATSHAISKSSFKAYEKEIEVKKVSVLKLKQIASAAFKKELVRLDQGEFVGSVILPDTTKEGHLIGSADIDGLHIDFGPTEQGAERMLICKSLGRVSDKQTGSIMTVYCNEDRAVIHMGQEEYQNIKPGFTGTIVMRDFANGSSYGFNCKTIKLMRPGRDAGNYIYVDGSGVSETENGYGYGYVSQIGDQVKAGYGDGVSSAANFAAELEACIRAMEDYPECDRLTICFDNTNIAYPLTGWFAISDDFRERALPLLKKFGHVTFLHVDGHAGVPGNEMADHLANYEKRNEIRRD